MGIFATANPPALPIAPAEYDHVYFNQLLNVLTLYLQKQNAVQPLNIGALNINIKTLPTQTALAELRIGDVYVDTTASNVLKVRLS